MTGRDHIVGQRRTPVDMRPHACRRSVDDQLVCSEDAGVDILVCDISSRAVARDNKAGYSRLGQYVSYRMCRTSASKDQCAVYAALCEQRGQGRAYALDVGVVSAQMPVADAYAVDGADGGRLVVGRIEIGYDRLLVGYGNVEPAQAVDGRYKILQCRYVGQFVQIIACVVDTLGGEFFFEITL